MVGSRITVCGLVRTSPPMDIMSDLGVGFGDAHIASHFLDQIQLEQFMTKEDALMRKSAALCN